VARWREGLALSGRFALQRERRDGRRGLPPRGSSRLRRRIGTVRQIFDFGARRAQCPAPPLKNRACPRLAPNLLEVGVERALMKCLTLVRDAHRAPRTVPTRLLMTFILINYK
jgi:hypothetical protein